MPPITELDMTPVRMPIPMLVFDGEIASAESGMETRYFGVSRLAIENVLRNMKDGDSIVVNCKHG